MSQGSRLNSGLILLAIFAVLIAWNLLFSGGLSSFQARNRKWFKRLLRSKFEAELRWLTALEGYRQRKLIAVAREAKPKGLDHIFQLFTDENVPELTYESLRPKVEILSNKGWIEVTKGDYDPVGTSWYLSLSEKGKNILKMHREGRSLEEIIESA